MAPLRRLRLSTSKGESHSIPHPDTGPAQPHEQQAEQENEAPIIQAALTEINEVITTYLDSIDDQEVLAATRNKMIALVKKYAKDAKGKPSGDYRTSQQPRMLLSFWKRSKNL